VVLNRDVAMLRDGCNLLRSIDPPLDDVFGRRVTALQRIGKRVVIGLEEERFLVIHLMIAGRFRWKPAGAKARVSCLRPLTVVSLAPASRSQKTSWPLTAAAST
jgi:formamidopyrimidine-DNA glycosylase